MSKRNRKLKISEGKALDLVATATVIEMEIVNPGALSLDADTPEQLRLARMVARRILAKYLPETKKEKKRSKKASPKGDKKQK